MVTGARRRLRLGPIWHGRDFRLFWLGQSVSFLGSEVSALALPLTAVVVLGASPAEMGLLVAVQNLPFLLVGLLAGVWVDRFRRRPILIAADLVDAVALGSIPLAVVAGWLRFDQLLLVAFVTGTSLVISSVAFQSFMPSLVRREHLVDANAAMEVSSSASTIVGPSVGGLLVQLVTAPIAIAVDAVSFLFSAVVLLGVRAPEPAPIPDERRAGVLQQVVEGLRHVGRHPLLRWIMVCGATHNFFARMIDALFVLFVITVVGLDPITLGLILAAGGPGALLGALLSSRVPRRIGLGQTLVVGQILTGISRLLIPAAMGSPAVAAAILALASFLWGVARPMFNVNQLSLRQAITPDRLQGRVNATMRFAMWSVTPFGAIVGGFAATIFGVREVLVVAGLGVLAATLPLALTQVGRLERQPDALAE